MLREVEPLSFRRRGSCACPLHGQRRGHTKLVTNLRCVSWRRKDRRGFRRDITHTDEVDNLWLDDGFVREAPAVELSAEQRAAKRRREALDWQVDEGSRQAARAFRMARRAKRRRRVSAVLAVVVVVSLFGWRAVQSRRDAPASSSPHGAIDPGPDRVVHGELVDRPPPSSEEARTPLGQPDPRPAVSDRYRFALTRPGSNAPVAYDPCRPIHVVVNNRTAPPGADALLGAALESVRRATGSCSWSTGPLTRPQLPSGRPTSPTATRSDGLLCLSHGRTPSRHRRSPVLSPGAVAAWRSPSATTGSR